MKLHLTTAIAMAIAAAASPVMAQDARETHFDGPYVSIFGGWTGQNNDGGDTFVFDNDGDGVRDDVVRNPAGADAFSPGFCSGDANGTTPATGCKGDKDGVGYGARIGYDSRMGGNFVLGGLVEVTKNESKDGTSAFSITPARYSIVRSLDYAASARLRAGYTPNGGALFYVTGGGSYAKINHRFSTSNTANSFTERRDGKMVWGWQAGGGGEIMVTDNVSFGLEYLYNRFRDNKYSVDVGAGTAPATNPFLIPSGGTNLTVSDRNFDFHSLRASLSYQF